MTDPGELRCYILYQSSPSPLPSQSHWESFCRVFISSSEGSVGVGVGAGERGLFIFLSQWGEAVYFTLQWCVSNHTNQVHLGSGITSDKRTKKLKSKEKGLSSVPAAGLTCRFLCLLCASLRGWWHSPGRGGSWGAPSSSAPGCSCSLRHSTLCLVPLLPCRCNLGDEVCREIRKWKALHES